MRADARPAASAGPGRLTAVLALLAAATTAVAAWRAVPSAGWAALLHPALGDAGAILFQEATLPRAVTALLCGCALALSGTILQQGLDNPLAAPSTLGLAAGAELALVATTVWAPDLLGFAGRDAVALAGALAAAAAVWLAAGSGLAPARVILAGLAVGLFAGACGAALKLLDQEEVGALYLWGAGSLAGTDWSTVRSLLPRLVALGLAAALVARPLDALSLSEGGARGLGVAVGPVRAAALGIAVLLASSVTASVGVIGLIEIAGPALARAAGARRFGARALHGALTGGCLLMLVDAGSRQLAQSFALVMPTGAAAALLGAPLLLVFAGRLRDGPFAAREVGPSDAPRRAGVGRRLAVLAAAALLALGFAVAVGRTGAGWSILGRDADLAMAAAYRAPRALAALGAGALLGAAGALLQRLTGNPLVGPETLGLGAGAACGLAAALFLAEAPSRATLVEAGALGAFAVLAMLALSSARRGFAPDRLLLTGVALGAGLQALLGAVLALGDARSTRLLAWMTGSTYGAGPGEAAAAAGLAAVLCVAAAGLGPALDVLALGPAVARGLGLALGPARGLAALLAAAMTGAAVLAVGPLSFVGLVGPQIALRLGCRRGSALVAGSALAGALVMALADLAGRTVAAPFEIPAGLVAAMVGVPSFLALLGRGRSGGIP